MKTRIVLLGPPASGKGTQAQKIKARFGLETASPGAMLREELRRQTALGIEAERLTRNGFMVPDATVIELVRRWLSEHPRKFVFDGFPRTLVQAEALEKTVSQKRSALDIVFFFDVSDETIFERVMNRVTCGQCGQSFSANLHLAPGQSVCPGCGGALGRRADDTPEVLEHRLVEYRENTEPLVAYYQKRGLLWPLSAAESPDQVFAEIAAALDPSKYSL